jgi:hypothetical protein
VSEDIFTERGIKPPWQDPRGVAARQGFARYEGSTWSERRTTLAALPGASAFGRDSHPDPDSWRDEEPEAFDWRLAHLSEPARRRPPDPDRSWKSWLVGALSVDGWARIAGPRSGVHLKPHRPR